jgi:putative ABC transport system ATP-binding protein
MNGLCKQYPMGTAQVTALNGIDLEISRGEFVAIMGTSGSGKSTLMNVLGCLDKPSSGVYFLNGTEVSLLDDAALSRVRNTQLGFVFQNFNLLSRMTALGNVALPLRYANPERADAEKRNKARELLEMVGLGARMDHRPAELSGGERQRVAIARALINEPAVLLADEPTGNLDSHTTLEIMELFSGLHDRGHTIVMVTHEHDVAAYARRVVVLKDGRIIDDHLQKKH